MEEPKNNSEFIIFKTVDEQVSVDVRLNENDVWLTQDQLASLYGVERPGITQHIKNIFTEGELQEDSVSKKLLRTAADGKKYQTKHYNLDMIISLGYRVNSIMATRFRIWATKRLNEYIRKGFTMDDERLKKQLINPTLPRDKHPQIAADR
ncbi:virulence RhuM family protein [Ostreibacterium oceani]|nr:RhuM family protein [Ostreibacterium oceani]